jgi:CRP-like cAMP-binding protein
MADRGPSPELVRGVPYFASLGEADTAELAAQFTERRYAAGDVVVGEGQHGMALFLVEDGEAEVRRGGGVVARLGPGDTFGELALFDHGGRRAASVVAAGELRCWSLPVWGFRSFVEGRPAVAWALLEQLAKRIRELEPAR